MWARLAAWNGWRTITRSFSTGASSLGICSRSTSMLPVIYETIIDKGDFEVINTQQLLPSNPRYMNVMYSSLSLLRYCWDKKKVQYIQTIEISSINFYCFVIVGILIWYHNKQNFGVSDIVITRDYCTTLAMFFSTTFSAKTWLLDWRCWWWRRH